MSSLDDLPPDQRAALAVLLGQRKSYADVAGMLGIPERAVHDRAHAALAVLAPALAGGLSADERAAIGDYLLDQPGAGVAERLQARSLLASSEPARAWAQALADALAPLGETAAIPPPARTGPAAGPAATPPAPATPPARASSTSAGEPPMAAPQPEARTSTSTSTPASPPVSRAGGAVVLGVLAAGAIIGILFATGVLDSGSSAKRAGAKGASKTTTGPTVDARLPLRPPNGSTSSAGLVQVLSEGEKRAFYVVAEGLAPTHGFFYALWLYNSPSSSEPLGKAPAVGSNKRLEGGGLLPTNAGQFKQILLTRETSTSARRPGPVVLRGRFTLTG